MRNLMIQIWPRWKKFDTPALVNSQFLALHQNEPRMWLRMGSSSLETLALDMDLLWMWSPSSSPVLSYQGGESSKISKTL